MAGKKARVFDGVQANVSGWETGRWYHVAVTVAGGMVTIYRDGEWLNSQSYGKWISMKPLAPSDLANPVHAAIGLLKSKPCPRAPEARWTHRRRSDLPAGARCTGGEIPFSRPGSGVGRQGFLISLTHCFLSITSHCSYSRGFAVYFENRIFGDDSTNRNLQISHIFLAGGQRLRHIFS